MAGRLGADLIALQLVGPRGRRRRGSRIGAVRSGGSAAASDVDEPVDDAPATAAPSLAVAVTAAQETGTEALVEQGDPILLRGLQMLAGLTELAHQARASFGSLSGFASAASRSGNRAIASGSEKMLAPADTSATTIGHDGHGHAGGDQSSDDPASQASEPESSPADDAGPTAPPALPYVAPLMNRRLETNGVDDALTLMLILRQMPKVIPDRSIGPTPVTQAQAIPAAFPPSIPLTVGRPPQSLDPAGDAEAFRRWLRLPPSAWRERNRHRRPDRQFRRRILTHAKPVAQCLPHAAVADQVRQQTSGTRGISAAECAAFWAGGCACRSAQSSNSAGASAIPDNTAS